VQFLVHFSPVLTLQLQSLVHPFFDLCFADLLFASFWFKSCQHAGEIELNIRSALEEMEVNEVEYEEQHTRLGSCIKFKVVEG